MKTQRSLRHVIMRCGASAYSGRHELPAGTARARVMRGVLVLTLALGGLGAATPALSAHNSAGPARAHSAGHAAMDSIIMSRPWMY
jgi:hypothetical protein